MLRIKRYILPDVDVENFDFTLLSSINKANPSFYKGRKTSSKYFGEDNELVAQKFFEDIVEDGNIVSLGMKIEWYNDDDSVGLTKEQVIKNYNKAEVKILLRKRRTRIIDYLIAASEGTPIETDVNEILKHYKTEIDLYIYNDTSDFVDGINNETDNTILGYLNRIIAPPTEEYPTGETVKDGILEQIS